MADTQSGDPVSSCMSHDAATVCTNDPAFDATDASQRERNGA
jgi:hypothetical protein